MPSGITDIYSSILKDILNDRFRSLQDTHTKSNNQRKESTLSETDRKLAIDPFATLEQSKRDSSISDLLKAYTLSYKNKQEKNETYRDFLFYSCLGIVVLISVFLLVFTIVYLCKTDNSLGEVVTLITVLVTFFGSIIGILKVITEYVFPKGDEKYITMIVKAVQQNDLDNKRELIKYNNGHGSDDDKTF